MNEQRRISISIPLRSIGLKRFVEKAIKDDEFFLFALENPIGAMKECGVNIDASSFLPKNFAAFFGALSRVKEMVKKKNINDLTFEGIFGQPADIRGTMSEFEVHQGFCRDFFIDAYQMHDSCFYHDVNFETDATGTIREITESSRESNTRRRRDDQIRNMESNHSSMTKFEKDVKRKEILLCDGHMLTGPLIHPEDLADLTARIETFTKIIEEVDQ